MAAIGLSIELAGAFAAGTWIQVLLFDVRPADPMTFATVGSVLAAAAVLATYLPARRAARVAPMDALGTD